MSMKNRVQYLLVALLSVTPVVLRAQGGYTSPADSLRHADSINSIKLSLPSPVSNRIKIMQQNANALNPSQQVNQLKDAAGNKIKQVDAAFTKGLDKVKGKPLSLNLSLEDAVRYQPVPTSLIINNNQTLVNNVYIQGTVQAFGIPLNIKFSNDHSSLTGLGDFNNSLFKFDFNPAQFAGMFKSDLQEYYDLRRNAFAGLDLAGYTRKTVLDKLKSQETVITGKLNNPALSQYLNNPAAITGLLSLSEDQIKQKLTTIAETGAKKINPVKQLNNINPADPLKGLEATTGKLAEEKLKKETAAFTQIAGNTQLQQYLNNPQNLTQLRQMNEQQVMQKLSSLTTGTPSSSPERQVMKFDLVNPVPGLSLTNCIQNAINDHAVAKNTALKSMAHQIVTTKPESVPVNTALQSNINTPGAVQPQTTKQIDSVARAITRIKEQLQSNGMDINKILLIQKMLDSGNGIMPATEQAGSLLAAKPANGIQSIFTKVQDLKIGSFGGQVPGGIQGQDVFMTGTHVTYKLGTIPVTAGYGTSNDIGTAKDAAYQSSVYSSPKKITYLGAQIRRGVFGNVKIAVVSSFGSDANFGNFGIPASSSNNVAFTLSKDMNMGKLGNVSVDVSKSTTLYNNHYQMGTDAILAQKAGVNLDIANDLFEAIGFGFNQHLDMKELDMSDNVYFNYSGMGYQNPGNNGYGGARKKLGGNLKKSFNKNKLTLNLRTDMSSMPISYTTTDQWKTYQVQLDSRYVISKKFNLSLKYNTNGTSKQVDNVTTPVYSFQKLQVDGNISYKIGKDFTVSHFSFAKQDYSNATAMTNVATTPGLTAANGSLIMATYTQSMVMGRNSLTATIFYNKELSSYALIGNMLNTDVSYQYTILDKISLSSGLTYLNNGNIANQVGIRQSVQVFGSKNFDLNTSVDIRKNLVTPLYPDLYSACRAELSLKYHLRN